MRQGDLRSVVDCIQNQTMDALRENKKKGKKAFPLLDVSSSPNPNVAIRVRPPVIMNASCAVRHILILLGADL